LQQGWPSPPDFRHCSSADSAAVVVVAALAVVGEVAVVVGLAAVVVAGAGQDK